jgi:hypothetical protein
MTGDILARGAKSATFPSMSHISQERWDAIFEPEPKKEDKPKKKQGKSR